MDNNGSRLRAFLGELRRRRVVRVAVVYAVASFGILQVADIAFPALKLPEWTITLVVAIVLLGFPVTMVLAWAFDITPKGVVRTEPLADERAPYRRHGRAPALAAVAVVSVLTIAVGWYVLPRLPGWWSVDRRVAADAGDRSKLVVLPFMNLGAPVDAYFADGVTEEITARLAVIDGLGVIARTTAVQYKDSNKTVQEIGAELGVDYVLEGTVRWENPPNGPSRVRVTPQLIRVEDATHVWAEIYEEPMASVFEVQSEIAERVAEALDVTLGEPERVALKVEHTNNVEAYQHYLLGETYLQSGTRTGSREALELFERAVDLDPDFDLARQKLAEAHANLYWGSFRLLFGVREEDYSSILDRVYPGYFGTDTASFHLAKGILLRRAGLEKEAAAHFDSARTVLEPQVALRRGDSRLHAQLGLAYAGLQRRDDAVREGELAVRLLPIAENDYAGAALADNLAHIHVLVGNSDAAITLLESLLETESPVSSAWLRADPTWDPLREIPEFKNLLGQD